MISIKSWYLNREKVQDLQSSVLINGMETKKIGS